MNKLIEILRGKRKDKKGFTLMEMLIVVAIIAILVAIAVPVFNSNLNAAKKAADDASIKTAYTEYVLFLTGSSDMAKPPSFDKNTKTLTLTDGSYVLKYYSDIENYTEYDASKSVVDKEWKGTK